MNRVFGNREWELAILSGLRRPSALHFLYGLSMMLVAFIAYSYFYLRWRRFVKHSKGAPELPKDLVWGHMLPMHEAMIKTRLPDGSQTHPGTIREILD
jgi:hypothetical protein